MKEERLLLLATIFFLIFLSYSYLDSFLINSFDNSEYGIAKRVIDGDTIEVGNYSIRLLGINSPEKGELGYDKAKQFLIDRVLNKEIKLVFGKNKFDLYHRKLAYVFLENKNINLESVENGYSGFYFPEGKDSYYKQFSNAWKNCLDKSINLCEKSEDYCIILDEWNIQSQKVILKNICNQNVNIEGWSVKDEGRKKYVFKEKILKQNEKIVLTNEDWNETYVWTRTGDSIFVRDEKGKLVIWNNY